MRVAIIGGSGYIGKALYSRLQMEPKIEQVLKIGQDPEEDISLDLSHSELFDYDVFNEMDQIIFTAALSSPDKCASDFEMAWNINVTGTARVIQEALSRESRVLFLSSDAVFGDKPGEIYAELAPTGASTPYGRMKKAIEDQFKDNSRFKVVRLSYVVSARDRFVTYCLNRMREGQTAEIYHPFYRNCITLGCVLDIICWLLFNWEEYIPWVLNAAGPELVSRVRIADEINRIFDGKLHYKICQLDNDFFKNRPRITQMVSTYMMPYKILNLNTFTEIFKKEMERYKNEC